jgi:hypothetical protein
MMDFFGFFFGWDRLDGGGQGGRKGVFGGVLKY